MGNPRRAGRSAVGKAGFKAFDGAIHAGHDGTQALDGRLMRTAPRIQMTNKPGVQCAEFACFLFERAREGRLGFGFRRRRCVLSVHFRVLAPAEFLFDGTLMPTR